MPAPFKKSELEKIKFLREEQQLSYAEIAEQLGRVNKDGKPNARSIMNQYLKLKKPKETILPITSTLPPEVAAILPPVVAAERPDLNELTRKQRVTFMKSQMPDSARGKHIFNNVLSSEEQDLFLEEYFNVLREEDSITSAEEQQLFNAVLHLVLAWRASAQDRQCYLKSPLSGYTGNDQQIYTDMFKKDYQENMKKYNDFMRTLKLSREQRLKDMQRQGTTFLDYAEKFAKNDEQAKAIDEILKLEAASQDELKRLQRNGWLVAGGLPDNNLPNFELRDVGVQPSGVPNES
jgi:hypothetical protein